MRMSNQQTQSQQSVGNQLVYLKIPEHKIYQWIDLFTSIAESMKEVIRGLDLVLQYLSVLTKMRPGQIVVPMPIPPPTPAPAPPQEMMQFKVVALPYKVVPKGFEKYPLSTGITEITLDGDAFVLTADSDILWSSRRDVFYPLWAGTYMVVYRSSEWSKLYLKAVTGTANAYLLTLGVTS